MSVATSVSVPTSMLRAGTIRRVVRRGDIYICGLCRRQHNDLEDAQVCVGHCWTDFLAMDPVVRKQRAVGVAHRCRFCARDFPSRAKAFQCASDCRANQTERQAHERELEAVDNGPTPKRLRTPKPVRSAPRPVASRPKKTTLASEVLIVTNTAASSDPVPIAADAIAAPSELTPKLVAAGESTSKPAAADKSRNRNMQKMFFRDQAQYVCNNCKSKYFTKVEVEKCFESHT